MNENFNRMRQANPLCDLTPPGRRQGLAAPAESARLPPDPTPYAPSPSRYSTTTSHRWRVWDGQRVAPAHGRGQQHQVRLVAGEQVQHLSAVHLRLRSLASASGLRVMTDTSGGSMPPFVAHHGADNLSTMSLRASTREHSSHRSLSGSIVSWYRNSKALCA